MQCVTLDKLAGQQVFPDVGIFHDLAQFGGLGIVIAFLIWKDVRADRTHERMSADHRSEMRLMEEKRLAYDKDRLATDKEQVAALSALTSAIRHDNH